MVARTTASAAARLAVGLGFVANTEPSGAGGVLGWLVQLGALGLLATSIIGLQGHSFMHYWWGLVLLGVGWNFLYVGGTTLLTYTYAMAERFRAQAVNEFLVFGTSATASLLAGTVMHFFGWSVLMLIPVPILLVICIALVALRNDPLLDRHAVRESPP